MLSHYFLNYENRWVLLPVFFKNADRVPGAQHGRASAVRDYLLVPLIKIEWVKDKICSATLKHGQHSRQQSFKVAGDSLNRRHIKQVGVVFQPSLEPVLFFRERELQIKSGSAFVDRHRFENQSREPQVFHWRILENTHHLEKRWVAQV